MRLHSALLLVTAPMLGCGDALVDGDYRGEPLITIRGEILQDEPLGVVDGRVLVSLFWGANTQSVSPQVEQAVNVRTEFPSRYMLDVYRPPSQEVMFQTPREAQTIAMGLILLYGDSDGDESYDPEVDALIGTSRSSVLIWVEENPEDTSLNLPPAQNFYIGNVDNTDCGGPPELGDPQNVSLIVGTVCEELADLNCDGRGNEWGVLCGD